MHACFTLVIKSIMPEPRQRITPLVTGYPGEPAGNDCQLALRYNTCGHCIVLRVGVEKTRADNLYHVQGIALLPVQGREQSNDLKLFNLDCSPYATPGCQSPLEAYPLVTDWWNQVMHDEAVAAGCAQMRAAVSCRAQ